VDLTLRIDACDSLRGHAVAFACVSTPLGRFPDCANPARPSNDSAQFVLNTRATGSASIALPAEPSNMLYVSVASEPFRDAGRAVASDAALARSVPPGSSYELSISDGAPLVIKAAPAMAATRISQSEVNITWQPPTAFAGALNASAVGLRYVAYYAHNLTDFAMRATGMSAADLGILPTTVCGLERWAALVAANFTPPVFAPGAIPGHIGYLEPRQGRELLVRMLGALPPPEAARVYIERQMDLWGKVVRDAKIEPE
jgi:hypothetical protein